MDSITSPSKLTQRIDNLLQVCIESMKNARKQELADFWHPAIEDLSKLAIGLVPAVNAEINQIPTSQTQMLLLVRLSQTCATAVDEIELQISRFKGPC